MRSSGLRGILVHEPRAAEFGSVTRRAFLRWVLGAGCGLGCGAGVGGWPHTLASSCGRPVGWGPRGAGTPTQGAPTPRTHLSFASEIGRPPTPAPQPPSACCLKTFDPCFPQTIGTLHEMLDAPLALERETHWSSRPSCCATCGSGLGGGRAISLARDRWVRAGGTPWVGVPSARGPHPTGRPQADASA